MPLVTQIAAYVGAITGIASLSILYIRFHWEKPRLDIVLNKRKRHGILFRYPHLDQRDRAGQIMVDKENPIDLAFMSLKFVNRSSLPISISDVEAFSDGKTYVHTSFPIIQVDGRGSLAFKHVDYFHSPLNIPAYESREAFVCVDITETEKSDLEKVNIKFHTSRGLFSELLTLPRGVHQE